jgi:hypothetical protein
MKRKVRSRVRMRWAGSIGRFDVMESLQFAGYSNSTVAFRCFWFLDPAFNNSVGRGKSVTSNFDSLPLPFLAD